VARTPSANVRIIGQSDKVSSYNRSVAVDRTDGCPENSQGSPAYSAATAIRSLAVSVSSTLKSAVSATP